MIWIVQHHFEPIEGHGITALIVEFKFPAKIEMAFSQMLAIRS